MIASCWDWPSLKYAYFVVEDMPLDAGGWSPTRGIVQKHTGAGNSQEVIAFDDCVPSLPTKKCYYAGSGDFCVGELFVKRDSGNRERLDMDLVRSQGTPDMKKLVELLEGTSVRAVNSSEERSISEAVRGKSRPNGKPRTLWSMLVPSLAGAGAGFAMYKLFSTEQSTDQNAKTIFFAWASGLAVGAALGQEYAEQPIGKEDDE